MRSEEKDFIEVLKNYKGWERKENIEKENERRRRKGEIKGIKNRWGKNK